LSLLDTDIDVIGENADESVPSWWRRWRRFSRVWLRIRGIAYSFVTSWECNQLRWINSQTAEQLASIEALWLTRLKTILFSRTCWSWTSIMNNEESTQNVSTRVRFLPPTSSTDWLWRCEGEHDCAHL
jgi:hypothetical protein